MENNIIFNNLKKFVLELAQKSDETVIITGYVGPTPIIDLAQICPKVTVVYGMYGRDGISHFLHSSLQKISNRFDNLNILYSKTGTHAKCYIYKKAGKIINVLVGSANFSEHGLTSPDNAEMLTLIPQTNFIPIAYFERFILDNCINCTDSSIKANSNTIKNKSIYKTTMLPLNNPFTAIMPLYIIDKKTKQKMTHRASGLNWGNSNNHHRISGAMEACIPISAKHIDTYPLLFPPKQMIRKSTDGKVSRVNDPIEIIWDDGYVMKAIFNGNGPVRNERLYPKQLTSNDGGGAELGQYIRTRLGLPERHIIEYSDLQKYGRDNITLTYIQEGLYTADFSV